MAGHFQDVRDWFRLGKRTDTFARHFVRHFRTKPKPVEVRALCRFKVLKEIEPFGFMKKVKTDECKLCMAERLAILKGKQKGYKLINENSELHGPCRHCARFHRFNGTDEPGKGEKGILFKEIRTDPPRKKKKKKRTALSRVNPNVVPTHKIVIDL